MPNPGFLTASTFPELMKKGKHGPFSTGGVKIIQRLALDMLEFEPPEEVTSGSLEWGKTNEDSAKYIYEMQTMRQVRKAKFRISPTLPYVGGTMDGLVAPDGGIEIKCPKDSAIHMFNRDEHFKDYEWQIHGYMWVYGLNWIDFVSYDPRAKLEYLELIIRHVRRDKAKIAELEARCKEAHAEAVKMANKVREEYAPHWKEAAIPF